MIEKFSAGVSQNFHLILKDMDGGILMLTPARLDKVTIYGFRIAAINKMRDLVRRNIVTIKQGVKLYCRTENNRYFSSIRIEATDAFDYFA